MNKKNNLSDHDFTNVTLDLSNTDFDFGFTTISNEVFVAASADNEKAKRMLAAIMPLLNNLLKDSDKGDNIYWPNRAEKIEAFKRKLDLIYDS